MKKYLFVLSLLALSVQSCKKGENDPSLSLRSRKSRLTGEWILKSSEGKSKKVEDGVVSMSTSVNYDGTQMVGVTIFNNPGSGLDTVSYTTNYTVTMNINKDGTYKVVRLGDDARSESGNWQFLHKSKKGEFKNKEVLMLIPTEWSNVDEGYVFTGYNDSGVRYFFIDRLANKEIALRSVVNYSYSYGYSQESEVLDSYER